MAQYLAINPNLTLLEHLLCLPTMEYLEAKLVYLSKHKQYVHLQLVRHRTIPSFAVVHY